MTRPTMPPSSRSSVAGLPVEAIAAIDHYRARGGDLDEPGVGDVIAALAEHAPSLLVYANVDPQLVVDVIARPLVRGDGEASFAARFDEATRDLDDGPELMRTLRRLRHRAVVRIALREIHRLADVDGTSAEMAALASAVTHAAYTVVRRSFEAKHGAIRDVDGQPIPFVVLGMGKLGGGELNLGSDVDFVLLYGTDEGTVGDSGMSVHDAFSRIAVRLSKVLAEPTEDGFCFRVDHRLRPEGSHGPLVNSLASAERYYEAFGRPWERAAMLRARPIAGDRELGERMIAELKPFVYPRTPDPRMPHELRAMVERSRRELAREPDRDVKLCRGGIREAEFFVQSLQLVWGGQQHMLQTPSTIRALRVLRSLGLVGHREAMQLGADWALLRRIEHRIHVWTGFQTHLLPKPGPDRERFARSLGFDGTASFERDLEAAKKRVADLFDSLIEDEPETPSDPAIDELVDRILTGAPREAIAESAAAALPIDDADEAVSHLRRLARTPASPFGSVGAQRSPGVAHLLLRETRHVAYPDGALRHLAEFFARLGTAFSYDRILASEPVLARRLMGLFGASSTLASALISHPDVIDTVFTGYESLPSEDAIRALHDEPALRSPDLDDEEDFIASLRRRKAELTLRIGLSYVSEEADFTLASARLTTLAEVQIACALDFAVATAERRYGVPVATDDELSGGLAVIGMGKLGSGELGFGSDLDLVFFFGAEGETPADASGRSMKSSDYYARVGQHVLRLLSAPDEEGPGYAVDVRLRPSGSRGLLSQSVAAFDVYYATQGANWERQALTRARPIAGDPGVALQMTARMHEVAFEREAPPAEEIAQMRRRLELELGGEKPDRFHVKYGYGGIVDVEFLAQWLAMKHGRHHPVRELATTRVLDALVPIGALSRDEAEALSEAYRLAREIEQASKLLDEHREPLLVPDGPIAERIARRLRMRNRDGVEPGAVLIDTWLRTAFEVRATFERRIAPVGVAPPWER